MANFSSIPSPSDELIRLVADARKAASFLGQATNEQRQLALFKVAEALESFKDEIVAANLEDLERSESESLSPALMSRLKLDLIKLGDAIEGVRTVAALPDPLGKRDLHRELDMGLVLERISVPLGVIGVIFEARPDALIQIASLAIRSGNGVLLKGGSEASLTNKILVKAIHQGILKSDIDYKSVGLLTTRQESMGLLHLDGLVDLIIPRGSNELVRYIKDNTRIPVLGHADGICHLYVDEKANLDKALRILIDSKTQYPAACNAVETLLIHQKIAKSFLNIAVPKLEELGVYLLGDGLSQKYGVSESACDNDWSSEYLDLKLSIKIVPDLKIALDHISRYGSRHTEAIVTEDPEIAKVFIKSVDSAGVFHNCSTRFADGFRYGFGAELGISTQTLPPRGPVGLEGLVTYRYQLQGDGHIAADYASGIKNFTHVDL